ncbi:Uncharacterized protein APZ42_025100 [Daphnia magna]|uniref:RNA-directed DNA polymerase n=1 Tax=Daphnia magna TaxID=35525 RepID=A0A164TGD6_9CRUS|nr:Uncharacterized protein APZ42_025100 [Daphnia magna]
MRVTYLNVTNITPGYKFPSTTEKPLRINCSFGSVDIEPPLKSRHVTKLTTITNKLNPRIPLKISQIFLQALFDTGASKSIIHERLFNKLPPSGQVIYSQLDFNLYDVGKKKLHTLGRLTLPVQYGESVLRQELIVTKGVTEDCILGWDAIQKHGFLLHGEAKSIYLARDEQGPLAISRVPDMAITTVKKTTPFRQTSLVIELQMKGSFPYVSPQTAFIFTPEENLPAVLSFLGFAGYYIKLIKDFGSIAKPLTRLTHKDLSRKPFAWGTEEQLLFEKLRNSLDCHEHPIAYSSRQLTKAESKYGTAEKEALAVIDAIKHFRHYLLDKPFEIIRDHNLCNG